MKLFSNILAAVIGRAPVARERDGWTWWSGRDGENYTDANDTRDAAIAALEGEGGYIIEARQDPLDLSDYLDAADLLERAEEAAFDQANEDGDPIFDAKPEQIADLEARLKRACDEWQAAHGLVFTPWCFTASRNRERIAATYNPDDPDFAEVEES